MSPYLLCMIGNSHWPTLEKFTQLLAPYFVHVLYDDINEAYDMTMMAVFLTRTFLLMHLYYTAILLRRKIGLQALDNDGLCTTFCCVVIELRQRQDT